MHSWYSVSNENEIDSPALLIYPELIKKNISLIKGLASNRSVLRPHVKTHKMVEVAQMHINEGITKFKCATIAEAEMLAISGAKDILLAYQPTEVKAKRLLNLVKKFPGTVFSCLIDNEDSAKILSKVFGNERVFVFIDVNIGMNRSGVKPQFVLSLFKSCQSLTNLEILGMHAYDGHIYDTDINLRRTRCEKVFEVVSSLKKSIDTLYHKNLKLVLGGTPTFAFYSGEDVETSPGTFVFWDEGYRSILPDLKFHLAAVLLVRIISIIDEHTLCLDLGHKAISSENPLPRIKFLNAEEPEEVGYSEEHLVVNVPDSSKYKIGDTWYGVPYHICPTVAVHNTVHVIENNSCTGQWKVIARDRYITI